MKRGFFFMFPFPIRFCPESVRRRVLDLFPQGYVCCSGCAKTITSAWHNCFLSRKRLLHKLGTTVSCRGNGRYIGMAQPIRRQVASCELTSRMPRSRHRTFRDRWYRTVSVCSTCFFVRPARAGVRLFARGSKSCVRTVSSACKCSAILLKQVVALGQSCFMQSR